MLRFSKAYWVKALIVKEIQYYLYHLRFKLYLYIFVSLRLALRLQLHSGSTLANKLRDKSASSRALPLWDCLISSNNISTVSIDFCRVNPFLSATALMLWVLVRVTDIGIVRVSFDVGDFTLPVRV
jgi:hypothetical protein